jgi:hypothetical protein
VLLEKMSKIMRMDPGDARSCHGGHHTEQFPFRSILQIKPGIRVDMTQYPMIDRCARVARSPVALSAVGACPHVLCVVPDVAV